MLSSPSSFVHVLLYRILKGEHTYIQAPAVTRAPGPFLKKKRTHLLLVFFCSMFVTIGVRCMRILYYNLGGLYQDKPIYHYNIIIRMQKNNLMRLIKKRKKHFYCKFYQFFLFVYILKRCTDYFKKCVTGTKVLIQLVLLRSVCKSGGKQTLLIGLEFNHKVQCSPPPLGYATEMRHALRENP